MFKAHNNIRKRTHQVPEASGSSILEDKWQRFGSFHEFRYQERGGEVLCTSKP
jgi:hypothetical protein